MPEELPETAHGAETPPEESPAGAPGAARLVPVAESIKYRRRAQQAETRLQELQKQRDDLQRQLQCRGDELAAAEAQRDEARVQVTAAGNRLTLERRLAQAGVLDVEAAALLLEKQMDLGEELAEEDLAGGIEKLLLDKPYLRGAGGKGTLPPRTASARGPGVGAAGQLADAAERAARTGDRRHVAEYLRLRRQIALAGGR